MQRVLLQFYRRGKKTTTPKTEGKKIKQNTDEKTNRQIFNRTVLMFDFLLSFAFCSHFALANWERHNFILCLNDVACRKGNCYATSLNENAKGVEYVEISKK